ncbi:MAG: phosphatase PAP2 family protein [Verrucomicrobiota bacterium]|nr:phosphatase PAP2 family protein [Verrucomicrobiota bacterium]
MKIRSALLYAALIISSAGLACAQSVSFHDAFGNFINPNARNDHRAPDFGLDPVRRWNQIALIATGLDHTPVLPGEDRIFGEQLGPCRAARAMAIVHIAIFDAVNAIEGGYQSYLPHDPAPAGTSQKAAVARAAHDTLAWLYPSQKKSFDGWLAEDLSEVVNADARRKGNHLGEEVAAAIIADRTNDGSQIPEPLLGVGWITSDQPGHWRQDPIAQQPIALGAFWNQVRPFGMVSAAQFRAPQPPALASREYAEAYREAKTLGGDGIVTRTARTPGQSFIGIFWAYDGVPSLCAPPRLYNQIAIQVTNDSHLKSVELARLLAQVNVAMADAGIACWDSKYYWDLWRPVAGIREADPGTGPTGLGDGNPHTKGDITCSPLGGQASNLSGPNFTPPFPAYPSGHATFGGALFQVLRRFYGRDDVAFTFISDEWNGITKDNQGNVRPLIPQSFTSFSQAEEDNGQSRIYLGIHWSFDRTSGITMGQQVADYDLDHLFLPL